MSQSAIVRWSNPETILVATNLLEGQTLVLHAIYQARLSRAAVLLVHVIRPSRLIAGTHEGAPSILPGSAVQAVKSKLDETAEEFRRAGILCEPIVLTGSPAEQIVRLVKTRTVDRVIAATRYASGVARLVEPSVAEELIATLNVPVCIIGRRAHPETEFGTPLDRVLLATSFDRGSSLLGRFASTLAEINDAQLTLIHVLDTQGVSKQQREMERLVARQMLSSLVPAEARHRNKPVLLIREGDPATIILEEAGSLPHDVVILGSSHSSMVSRLLADSVVHRVVIESQCPVITIKSSSLSSLEEVHESTSSEVMSAHS